MSFEAKGMLCFILSLPDDWTLYKDWLMTEFGIGRTYLNRCLKEIEGAGFLQRTEQIQGEGGKFIGSGFVFFEESSPETSAQNQQVPLHETSTGPLLVTPQRSNEHLLSTNTIPSTNNTSNTISNDNAEKSSKRFEKPTPAQVEEYAASINFNLPGAKFCDYYQSKGWMIGKNPMKDWKAAVRTWHRKEKENGNNTNSGTHRVSSDFSGKL